MAEIWYVGIKDTEFDEKEQKIHEIPLRACIELLDLRPKYLTCNLDEFPKLTTEYRFHINTVEYILVRGFTLIVKIYTCM